MFARRSLRLLASLLAMCGGTALSPGAAMAEPRKPTDATARGVAAAQVKQPQQRRVRRAMLRLERRTDSRIGMFAIDTGSRRAVRYRAGERFPIASVFKAFACAGVLRRARRSDPGLLDRRLRWTRAELAEYSPITERHVESGLTVRELCDATVRYSDNTAGNLILDQIGGPAGFTRYMRSLGDRVTRLDRTEPDLNRWAPGSMLDTTTPEAAGRSLAATTLGRSIPRSDRNRMIDWLVRNTTGDKRIRAGLPRGWKVGDKTGSGGSYAWGNANDVAIAWPRGRRAPIVIAVFTNRRRADAPALDTHIERSARIAIRGLRVGP